ncbi:MAG: hypothetical protein P8Z30_07370 [Acidobacteriota bacterium]
MKNNAISDQTKVDQKRLDETALRRRAAEDAVGDADSYAIRVRRQFQNVAMPSGRERSDYSLSKETAGGKVGPLEEIDGVLIHAVEGTTRLILSDEILEISSTSAGESIVVEPIRLFHVQSRAPWTQQVRAGAA